MSKKIFLVKTTTERNIRQITFDHLFNKGSEKGVADTLLKLEGFVELTKEEIEFLKATLEQSIELIETNESKLKARKLLKKLEVFQK